MLELRGVRRVDQNAIIDTFVNATASHNDLEDTSFLTALDLEAASQPLGQTGSMGLVDGVSTPPLGGGGRNSFHLNRQYSSTQEQGYTTRDGARSPPPSGANADGQGPGRAFGDLRRFGTLFGAALGRRKADAEEGGA